MPAWFVALYALAAAAAAYAADRWPRRLALGLKAVPVSLLIGLLSARALGGAAGSLLIFTLAGLAFSLAGDLAIERRFLAGLVAFFVAHVAYLVAMGLPGGRPVAYVPAAALAIGGLAVLARRVEPALRGAVAIYVAVLALMLGRALERALLVPPPPGAALMAAGAAIFTASDGLLAADRWLRRLPASQVLILGTYFTAQALIAAGAL